MDLDLDAEDFDSESEDGGGQEDEGKRPVHDLAQIISEEAGTDFPFTTEHVLLCRLISMYGKCALKPGEQETWVRSTPLNVLIYECIAAGVLDFDYAPVLADISYKGESKKVWLNFSQEALAAIDDLRETNMIRAVRMYTEDYKPSTCFQVSMAGLAMMKAVPPALFDELRHVVYVPDDENTYKDMVQIAWNPHKGIFALKSDKTGYYRYSTVTEVEDVSYVCSPYVPDVLRRGTEPCTNNRGRAEEAFRGMSNVKDGDLMEAITLGEVRYLLVEWVPFGENAISHMCLNLGALDRNRGGMFTSEVDKNPSDLILNVPAGLTQVKILDCDMMHHINVEAEINYPEDEGIVQVEFFGIHISTVGNVLYGLQVDSIMTRDADHVSIDLLTRMAVDVVQDSSTILDDMMTEYQRVQMDALYQGHPDVRRKYCAYISKSIEPCFATFAQYLDGQDHENEIAQIIGQVRLGKDLTEQHFLFIGTIGLLLVGPRAHNYDAYVVPFCNLQAMMLAAGTIYERFNHIFQMLDEAMNLSFNIETTPFNVGRVQFLMSRAASEINILDFVISQLVEGVQKALMPPEPRDELGIRIYTVLQCRSWQKRIGQRVKALQGLMRDALRKTGYIQRYTDLVNKHELFHSVRRTNDWTFSLCLKSKRVTYKTRNIWIVQTLFGFLLLIKCSSKYRTGIQYCDVLQMNKTLAIELSGLSLYNFEEQPDGIYSEDCTWMNEWAVFNIRSPYVLLPMLVGVVVALCFILDAVTFFFQKARTNAISHSQMGWRAGHGTEKRGIICHRQVALLPFNENNLYLYIKDKRILVKRLQREVLPGPLMHGRKEPDEYGSLVLVQWVETESKLFREWRGMPPTISLIFEQEIGFIRSIKFDVNKRVSGLHVDEAWEILRERWVKAGVIKREHCTPEAMAAGDGKWAKTDDEARKAAAMAADIAVAEASGATKTMSKKEKVAALKKMQQEAADHAISEYKASKKANAEFNQKKDRLKSYKGLGRKVAAEWKRESKQARTEAKKTEKERRDFHLESKRRVVERLMKPRTGFAAWVESLFTKASTTVQDGSNRKGEKTKESWPKESERDLEVGGSGEEEEDDAKEESAPRPSAVDDSDEEQGDLEGTKSEGGRRGSSRESTVGSNGLSEADTKAPPAVLPADDSDDD